MSDEQRTLGTLPTSARLRPGPTFRTFRFRLRALFVVTAVIGLAMAATLWCLRTQILIERCRSAGITVKQHPNGLLITVDVCSSDPVGLRSVELLSTKIDTITFTAQDCGKLDRAIDGELLAETLNRLAENVSIDLRGEVIEPRVIRSLSSHRSVLLFSDTWDAASVDALASLNEIEYLQIQMPYLFPEHLESMGRMRKVKQFHIETSSSEDDSPTNLCMLHDWKRFAKNPTFERISIDVHEIKP